MHLFLGAVPSHFCFVQFREAPGEEKHVFAFVQYCYTLCQEKRFPYLCDTTIRFDGQSVPRLALPSAFPPSFHCFPILFVFFSISSRKIIVAFVQYHYMHCEQKRFPTLCNFTGHHVSRSAFRLCAISRYTLTICFSGVKSRHFGSFFRLPLRFSRTFSKFSYTAPNNSLKSAKILCNSTARYHKKAQSIPLLTSATKGYCTPCFPPEPNG